MEVSRRYPSQRYRTGRLTEALLASDLRVLTAGTPSDTYCWYSPTSSLCRCCAHPVKIVLIIKLVPLCDNRTPVTGSGNHRGGGGQLIVLHTCRCYATDDAVPCDAAGLTAFYVEICSGLKVCGVVDIGYDTC